MPARRSTLHVATYADDDAGGVSSFDLEPGCGALRLAGERRGIPRILALALHPSGRVLYAASESGSIFALALDGESPQPLSVRPSGGSVPCSLAVAPGGTHLLTANYGSGSVAVYPIASDGEIGPLAQLVEYEGSGPVADRQEASHPHEVVFDADGANLLVSDLGADAIRVHRLDPAGGRLEQISSCDVPAGSGPRHLAVADTSRVLAADELSSTVSWYGYRPRAGALQWGGRVAASSRSDDEALPVNYPSEIAVDRRARFAYVGNRGHGTIGVFAVRPEGLAHVEDVECGRWPQHFALLGDRLYVAAQDDDAVLALTVGADGVPREPRNVAEVPRPSWVLAA